MRHARASLEHTPAYSGKPHTPSFKHDSSEKNRLPVDPPRALRDGAAGLSTHNGRSAVAWGDCLDRPCRRNECGERRGRTAQRRFRQQCRRAGSRFSRAQMRWQKKPPRNAGAFLSCAKLI